MYFSCWLFFTEQATFVVLLVHFPDVFTHYHTVMSKFFVRFIECLQ